jgi:hypothetical protein
MNESQPQVRYSYAAHASETMNVAFPVTTNMSWDGFWRAAYNKANSVIQQQANQLMQRGNITLAEAKYLVETQRNALILEMRKPLSPFGKLYSERLKPAASLPTLESLLQRKGNIEAILLSVGKTRAVTNKISFIARAAGPAGAILEITAVSVVVEQAPPSERSRVAAEEISGAVGGLATGTAGMWAGGLAGAVWAGTWAAPTLAIPVIGVITEGGAILLGGIVGGLFSSWAGHRASKAIASEVWSRTSTQWK